jgi:peptidyl-dipeptidase Dcp
MADHDQNPLLQPWQTPYGLPPFDRLEAEHYLPAFLHAMHTHRAEVKAIAEGSDAPSFGNTIAALDKSGQDLHRLERLFFNLTASETSDDLQAIERDISPQLAAHRSAIAMDSNLFARVDAVNDRRDELPAGGEERRLTERIHLDLVREGARLSPAAKARYAAIVERLASLTTQFMQNVLADEAAYRLPLASEDDFAGLPDYLREAAREAAQERGVDTPGIITLSRSLIVPFLTYSDRRDLREQAYKAWTTRGEHDGPHDNRPIAREILALRNEQARLHGYRHYAEYALADRMAGTPDAVAQLLRQVWEPAKARAAAERDALAALAKEQGATHAIEPWDWRYYAEKVRKARYQLDDGQLKPYFSLERMLEAVFDTAHRLFGLSFVPRPDIHAYHPDVRVFEVRGADDCMVGVFLSDNYARPNKRGGAWMSAYRWQSRANGDTLPIIVNNNNFAKGPAGAPTLLSADDVRTLFHEFGHGLHGLLSQVTYERLSGTNVLRDFVELPSQLFEHWALESAVLKRHALHHATGEAIPDALIDRLNEARRFNQGFETVEYTASALIDMALHSEVDPAGVDISAFERAEMQRIGMPREILPRHRLPHFGHLFASSGYAAGYYVYLWAEVLDADGYDAFVEAGNPFDPDVAERMKRYIYSSGGTLPPADAFRSFRGRDPRVEPLLAQRGLADSPQPA